jgi:hypothetical protein
VIASLRKVHRGGYKYVYNIRDVPMFLSNKYTSTYDRIIERARSRELNEGFERHHVLPKSMGGANDASNIVRLTYREHFLCHELLVKMTEGLDRIRMSFALHTFFHFNAHRRLNFSARDYAMFKSVMEQAYAKRVPYEKPEEFRFKHRKTGEEFIGTRSDFKRHTGISAQSANFLFNEAIKWDNPKRWIKGWGIWVEEARDWSFNKKMAPRIPQRRCCEHCGRQTSLANYTRWHGPRCSSVDPIGHETRTKQVASINRY